MQLLVNPSVFKIPVFLGIKCSFSVLVAEAVSFRSG